MPIPLTSSPVLVTGATGFIAAEIVRQVLALGYNVRGTTRDIAKSVEDGFLTSLPGAERLELIEADLLTPGAFDNAVVGCEYVIHTASPYVLDVEDPQTDLVDPAVQGTISLLEAAAATESVRRVILTSSFVAIADSPTERALSEEDWNTTSTLESNPYAYSKTEAERTAWRYMDENGPSFDLVVLNPAIVIGPSIVPRLNQSHVTFTALTHGEFPGIISLSGVFVDVRDVARAHVLALEKPSAAGRYLLAADTRSLRDLVTVGNELGLGDRFKFPSLPLDNSLGNVVTRFAANFQAKGTRTFLKTHVGKEYRIDNSKSQQDLGLEYRDLDQTIADAWTDLETWGHLSVG